MIKEVTIIFYDNKGVEVDRDVNKYLNTYASILTYANLMVENSINIKSYRIIF